MKYQVLYMFVIHCTPKFINVFGSNLSLALCCLQNEDSNTFYMSKGVMKINYL